MLGMVRSAIAKAIADEPIERGTRRFARQSAHQGNDLKIPKNTAPAAAAKVSSPSAVMPRPASG
jgi:hypothetical protein